MALSSIHMPHSMGGSVAVHVAAKKLIPHLAGLVVVDVVEVRFTLKEFSGILLAL